MSPWRAIVPLNFGGDCKTRLAAELSPSEREQVVRAMAGRVLAAVGSVVSNVAVLSPEPPPFAAHWIPDTGLGLNAELAAALGQAPVLIVHADLPLLDPADIAALLAAVEAHGSAIAPDRLGTGTNALALLKPGGFTPAFGPGSFAAHRALLPGAAMVLRDGLSHDLDTPDDLALLRHRLPDILPGD